jgi:hypothetical protein
LKSLVKQAIFVIIQQRQMQRLLCLRSLQNRIAMYRYFTSALLTICCISGTAVAQKSLQEPTELRPGIVAPFSEGKMPNIFTPSVNVLLSDDGTGASFGFVYEHFLDKKGIVSLIIPIYYFKAKDLYNSGGFWGAPIVTHEKDARGFYFAPGFMLHASSNKHFDFSAGPEFMFGAAGRNEENGYQDTHESGSLTGMLAVMNFTWQSTGGFVFIPNLSIGSVFGGPSQGLVLQTGIRIGGRF